MAVLMLADLRSRWRSLTALAAGCFVVLVAMAGTYSAYGGSAGFAKSFGAGHTPRLFSAFSGSPSADVFSPVNYLSFGFSHPLLLVLVFSVAITSGVAAVAADVETGRAELLFTAPVRRTAIFDIRVAGWLLAESVIVSGALAGALIGSRLSADLSGVSPLVPLRVVVQLAALVFVVAALAFAVSARARTRGTALGLTVGIVAGAYVGNLVALLWHPLAFVQRVEPFGYYRPTVAAVHVAWGDAAILVGTGLALLMLARRWLSARDLA